MHTHPSIKKEADIKQCYPHQLTVVPLMTWSNRTKASYDIADIHQTNLELTELILLFSFVCVTFSNPHNLSGISQMEETPPSGLIR